MLISIISRCDKFGSLDKFCFQQNIINTSENLLTRAEEYKVLQNKTFAIIASSATESYQGALNSLIYDSSHKQKIRQC